MATRDEPSDPPAPTDAEAAYLALRRTVRIAPAADTAPPRDAGGPEGTSDPDDLAAGERPTVRLPDQRATVRLPGRGRRRAPVALAAAVAAGTAALVSLAPVVAAVALLRLAEDGELAVAAPARVAAAGWLLGHGVPLQVGTGAVGLVPLTVAVLAAWRLARAGVHVTRAIGGRHTGSWRRALVAAGATGLAYGAIGLLVGAVATGGGWWAAPLRAGATLALFGFAAASYGALRATGALAVLLARMPGSVREGLRAGVVAALLVLAAGAGAAGVAVAVSGGAAADTFAAYRTGVAGQAGVTLVCLAYLPNLAVWAAAYLVGPGFVVGAGTVVRSSEVLVGPLPAVPVLAGLPDTPHPVLGATLLVVPTAAGAVAGWLLVRRCQLRPSWPRLLGRAALAAPVAGVLLGAAALAAAGSLGTGHLTTLGPVAWQVAAIGAALVLPGSVLGAACAVVLSKR